MTFNNFLGNCSQPAILRGVLRGKSVNVEFKETAVYEVFNRNGVIVTLDNYPPESRPAKIDASSSTLYRFYGKPVRHAPTTYDSSSCWLSVDKMENMQQAYPLPE